VWLHVVSVGATPEEYETLTPADIRPSCTVITEGQEDFVSRSLRRENDDSNDDREECAKVSSDKQALGHWQVLRPEHVESSNSEHRSEDQQGRLPPGRYVALCVVDDYQALDDKTDKPAVEGDDTLPGDGGQPT
jgi:hypothetical protein